jgi:CheY-specific phosphatase CheX
MNLNEPNLRRQAAQAAVEVLDTMFFELPTGGPENCDSPPPEALCALTVFTGTAQGCFAVALEAPSLQRLSASFLGADEAEVTEGLGSHVLCELANMLCGATLSRVGPDSHIIISTPRVVSSSEVSSSPWVRFPMECGSLAISLTYRGL